MNISDLLSAFTTAMQTLNSISSEVAALRARVATLEAQVAEHDKAIKPAPPPGPKEN